jgi:tRNA G18 (ribose-2'-O)-methylase SpoU
MDEKAKSPMFWTIGSLNVSVACGAFYMKQYDKEAKYVNTDFQKTN